MKDERRCLDCNRKLSPTKKLNICSCCQTRSYWKQKYEELREEFERHKKLCSNILLDYYTRLKKLEPNIKWGDEPELFMKEGVLEK